MAFYKPVESELFAFYGIFVSMGEISMAMKRTKFNGDIYSFFSSHGVDYMRAENVIRSNEFVVGKRLVFIPNFVKTQFTFAEDGSLKFSDFNINKLKESEELEVRKKTFEMGFFADTRYYLIQNYKSNKIC